jgi:Fe-S cluster assembly protein SufD
MAKQQSEADMALAALFEQRKNDRAEDLRAQAWRAFERAGLPNRRVESWHYTDLRAALREIAPQAVQGGAPVRPPAEDDRLSLAVVDGAFVAEPSASTPEGVKVSSLRDALAHGDPEVMEALAPRTDDPAVALNAALMQDGVVVRIAPGAQLERPLMLTTLLGAGVSAFTRNLVIVGDGARATIVEAGQPLPAGAQENHALVLALGAGAKVEHLAEFGSSDAEAVRVHSFLVSSSEKSALNSTCLTSGGGLLRRQVFARLIGEGAEVGFSGVTLLKERDHADTTLLVEHTAANGKSRECFRNIIDGEANGVFQGKISVTREAQKTDGAMQSKALLLSAGATMNNKPELEIFADDVVCGHGATCGRLDADQLFYLMARGLPRREAEALLIEGFANEALAQLESEVLRDALAGKISAWLAARELAAQGSAQ